MLPLVVVSFASAWSYQSVREATTASGVDMQPADWQTPPNGIIHPQRSDHYAKNNWKEPRSILTSSADRVAHIGDAQPTWCVSNTRAGGV